MTWVFGYVESNDGLDAASLTAVISSLVGLNGEFEGSKGDD